MHEMYICEKATRTSSQDYSMFSLQFEGGWVDADSFPRSFSIFLRNSEGFFAHWSAADVGEVSAA